MVLSKDVKKTIKVIFLGLTCATLASGASAMTVRCAHLHYVEDTQANTRVKFTDLTPKYHEVDVVFALRLLGKLDVSKYYANDLNRGFVMGDLILGLSYMAQVAFVAPLMDMSTLVILTSGNN